MQAGLASVLRGALLTGLYFAGAVIAVLYLRTPADVTLFWPAAGIGFAAVVRHGLRYALIIPVATLLLHLFVVPVPPLFMAYSIASNTLATLLAGWYVRRGREPSVHLRTGDGFMLLRGGVLLSLASGTIGTIGMLHAGMAPRAEVGRVFLQWTLGDLLGVTCLTPLLLYLLYRNSDSPQRRPVNGYELVVWSALVVLMLGVVYSIGKIGTQYPLALATLPLGLLLWSAVRYPPLVTLLGTSIVIVCVSLMTGLGIGGLDRPQTLHDSALMMVMLVTYSIIPVLLLASRQEHAHATAALHQRATRDRLTGLLNRDTFKEHARQLLLASEDTLTLLYTDLDHFKLVNDSASHVAGDEMIRSVAALVQSEFGDSALIARTGGDEFAVLARLDAAGANTRGRRLLAAIEGMRVAWQGQNLATTASIGLTTSQPPHMAFDELLSKTDAACFEAKELGGNRLFATEQNAEGIRVRTRLMHSAMDAREALDRRRVDLWCQPIVDLRTPGPEPSHFEVLMRWRDAEGNLRPPGELIAAAERYRMGPRLDRYVCGEVLAWLESHPDAAAKVEQCSINIGAATLTDEDFSDYFANRLRRSALRPEQFCLEITETSVVRDMTRTRRFIGRMRDLGCTFALDDFGTGFCSFGYLRDLDVDYLKIDGSFVRDLDDSHGTGSGLSEAVVRSITEIAHLLGKRAVGEQAETELQLQHLRDLGVDYAQGYVFHRPQPINAFFGLAEID